jgi:transcriptional regulator with XRE-family HTH domain
LTDVPGGGGAPAALRIMLGTQLRRLREGRRVTLDEAAAAIRASRARMGRLETGRAGFSGRELAELLTFYAVTDSQQRDALGDLARNASARGWWLSYSDILPDWFEAYVGLEEAAIGIRSYEVQFVPGLLQTPDYARAVTLLGHPSAHPADIDRRVSLRMARQEVLSGRTPPYLWAVIDEAALRRPAGRPGVMRHQLKNLLEAAERPNITIQVVPFDAGGHAAAGGPFSILRFAEPDLPDVVYLEQLTSALYLDEREDVEHYLAVMERLCIEATPASASGKIIHSILRDL